MYIIYTNNEISGVSSVPTMIESADNVKVVEATQTEYESALLKIHKKQEKQQRIEALKQLLDNTDYQAIKYAEGQITPKDYEPIKSMRQQWRDEINELEEVSNAAHTE